MKPLQAKDIMTKDILTAREDWPLPRLVEFLSENCISGAPVISDDGRIIGVVSLTDIVRHHAPTMESSGPDEPHEYYIRGIERFCAPHEIASLHLVEEPGPTVRDIMTPTVFQVPEEMPIQMVADAMIKNRVHRIFVTRDKRTVGVISSVDMLKVLRDM